MAWRVREEERKAYAWRNKGGVIRRRRRSREGMDLRKREGGKRRRKIM